MSAELREERQAWLVRMLRGIQRHQVYGLSEFSGPRHWRFTGGVAVVDRSLTQALDTAHNLLGRSDSVE